MLSLVAQDVIKVSSRGAKPTISDFAWAFVVAVDNIEECGDKPSNAIKEAITRQRKGLPQEEGVTFVIDEKNGYIFYEHRYDNVVHRMEMCYWNEADRKHKLFAFNNMGLFINGKPEYTETSGLTFWRYDNATGKMVYCDPPGFVVEYSAISYSLPRIGKDITVTRWKDDGTTVDEKLKWNGRRFK